MATSPRDDDETDGLEGLNASPPKETVIGHGGKIYTDRTFSLLDVADEPRRSAILLIERPWFDPLILITIMCNCTTMAWESPLDPTGTLKSSFIDVCEWIYLLIFTVEMLSKILAYGFAFHKQAYLQDPWCQLDFIVVSLAWIPIIVRAPPTTPVFVVALGVTILSRAPIHSRTFCLQHRSRRLATILSFGQCVHCDRCAH